MERAFIERKKSIDHKSKTYLTWCRIKVVQTMIPGELGDMIKQQRGRVECFNRDI